MRIIATTIAMSATELMPTALHTCQLGANEVIDVPLLVASLWIISLTRPKKPTPDRQQIRTSTQTPPAHQMMIRPMLLRRNSSATPTPRAIAISALPPTVITSHGRSELAVLSVLLRLLTACPNDW